MEVFEWQEEQELFEKEQVKREEIKKGLEKQENPSVSDYYERWVKGRKETISEATLRTQDKFFGVMKKVKMADLSRKWVRNDEKRDKTRIFSRRETALSGQRSCHS